METIKFRLKGLTPTLQHNGRLANPRDPVAKEIKKFSSLRRKEDEHRIAIADLEWIGGLYTDKDIAFEVNGTDVTMKPTDAVVIWPGDRILRMLQTGATRSRLGKKVQAAVFCTHDPVLRHEGSGRKLNDLLPDQRFRDFRKAGVGDKAVMRTRPSFPNWCLDVEFEFVPQEISREALIKSMAEAGQFIGLSDNRPLFGRFEVTAY